MIKSDTWIRRMAIEKRMIEPFEPGQVRELNGQKIVSYGTSSYGYDIRCSNEFKLFTNLNSTIVDNTAAGSNSRGGGVYSTGSVMVTNSTFDANRAGTGGNLFVDSGSSSFRAGRSAAAHSEAAGCSPSSAASPARIALRSASSGSGVISSGITKRG